MTQQSPVIEAVELSALATFSDIWPLLDVLLMKSPPTERKAPVLERVNVSIRPLNPNAWPPLPCGCAINNCRCGD